MLYPAETTFQPGCRTQVTCWSCCGLNPPQYLFLSFGRLPRRRPVVIRTLLPLVIRRLRHRTGRATYREAICAFRCSLFLVRSLPLPQLRNAFRRDFFFSVTFRGRRNILCPFPIVVDSDLPGHSFRWRSAHRFPILICLWLGPRQCEGFVDWSLVLSFPLPVPVSSCLWADSPFRLPHFVLNRVPAVSCVGVAAAWLSAMNCRSPRLVTDLRTPPDESFLSCVSVPGLAFRRMLSRALHRPVRTPCFQPSTAEHA